MSANRHDYHCPECGTRDILEISRQEGGFNSATGEDTIIYACQREECAHAWDTEMPRPTEPRKCAHDLIEDVSTYGGGVRPQGVCMACGAQFVQTDDGEWERP